MTNDERQRDRDVIRRRRALFMSSALAALACEPATSGPSEPVVHIPVQPATHLSAEPTAAPQQPPPKNSSSLNLPPWSEVKRLAPPFEVDANTPASEKAALEALADSVTPLYERLAKLWRAPPVDCLPTSESCAKPWTSFETELGSLDDAVARMRPLCGNRNVRTAVALRSRHHLAQLQLRVHELRAAVQKRVAGWDEANREAYKNVVRPRVMMRPCLSCIAPMDLDFSGFMIGFDDGSSDLKDSARSTLDWVAKRIVKAAGRRIQVRGHSDRGEGDLKRLSRARADEVVQYLVSAGVPANRLVAVGLSDALPVGSPTPGGREANRRVDLELF